MGMAFCDPIFDCATELENKIVMEKSTFIAMIVFWPISLSIVIFISVAVYYKKKSK